MIIDKIDNISNYYPILPSLEKYTSFESEICNDMSSFSCDKERSTLIVVKSGCTKIATSWREALDSNDVLGVHVVNENEFALFLPGEKYIIKESSSTIKYSLE